MGCSTNPSLLDVLASRAHCMYISDLLWRDRKQLAAIVRKIPAEDYSLQVWQDAIRYLYRVDPDVQTVSAAKAFFIHAAK